MSLFYEDETTRLYCADNAAVLPTLADGCADLVLTDPPYSERTHKGARTARNTAFKAGDTSHELITFRPITVSELRGTMREITRISNSWTLAFMDYVHIAHFTRRPPKGSRFVRMGVWVKPNGAPQFTGDRPAQGWEGIAIMHREGVRLAWNGGGSRAVWTYPKAQPAIHPSEKPIPLLVDLLTLFSNAGDLVIDPFMGSGSAGEACVRTGRRFIGCDVSEEYCEMAKARILRAKGIPHDPPKSIRRQIDTPLFEANA